MECRLSYPYPRCQNMKRSRVDVAEDGTLSFKKPKIVVAPKSLNNLFSMVRSLFMDQIKTVLMNEELYPVYWYARGIKFSSWNYIHMFWSKQSNPLYHHLVSVEMLRLDENVLASWKFYCLLKMVCK